MSYTVLLGEQPREFLEAADVKTERIVCDNLLGVAETLHPRPGAGRGDREKFPVDGWGLYRLRIGRSYGAFYTIHDDDSEVRVREILPIDDPHNRYGY